MTRFHGAPGLGFFRLNMTIEFMLQPASLEGVQQGQAALPGQVAGGVMRSDQVAIEADRRNAPQITELYAEVMLGGRLIGHFTPLYPTALPIRPYPHQAIQQTAVLSCDLDVARLEAIEKGRAGASFTLDISVSGRFSDGSTFTETQPLPVNQGVWTDVLATVGSGRPCWSGSRCRTCTPSPR